MDNTYNERKDEFHRKIDEVIGNCINNFLDEGNDPSGLNGIRYAIHYINKKFTIL
jgi:hypothetical protein